MVPEWFLFIPALAVWFLSLCLSLPSSRLLLAWGDASPVYIGAEGLGSPFRDAVWFADGWIPGSPTVKPFSCPVAAWLSGFILRTAGDPTNARVCHTLRTPCNSLPICSALLSLFIDRHFNCGGRKKKMQTHVGWVWCFEQEPDWGALSFNPDLKWVLGLARCPGRERKEYYVLFWLSRNEERENSEHIFQMSKRQEQRNLRQGIWG